MVSQIEDIICSGEKRIVELQQQTKPRLILENQWVYIWNAIDVDDRSILVVHVSTTRTSLDAIYFLRKVLEHCENKPLILVEQRTMVSLGFTETRFKIWSSNLWRKKCYRTMVQPLQIPSKTILEKIPLSQLTREYQNMDNSMVCHL